MRTREEGFPSRFVSFDLPLLVAKLRIFDIKAAKLRVNSFRFEEEEQRRKLVEIYEIRVNIESRSSYIGLLRRFTPLTPCTMSRSRERLDTVKRNRA